MFCYQSKEVIELVGIGRTSIYKLEKEGRFPSRVKMGIRCTRWHKSDIEKYIASL
jgi:prophage regulatory protein